MNGYRRRSPHEHNGYATDHQIPMAECYEGSANDFGYHAPNPYGIPHHPFGSYAPQFASCYAQSTSVGGQNSEMRSPLGQISAHHQTLVQDSSYRQQRCVSPSRYPDATRLISICDMFPETEVESQESPNEDTMLSEPVIPPLEGFPDVREFDQLMQSYVNDLSIKKQDKALIHAKRARNIKTVLVDPKDTAVESAQFRFWVKKMFKLQPDDGRTPDSEKLICHEGKPVAIREKLFKILTKAHQQCQHGGRDKTSAQVRQIYSWVPKELISRFVKICPTCQVRRGGLHLTPPNSRRGSPRLEATLPSPKLLSPPPPLPDPTYRRKSTYSLPGSSERSQADGFAQGHVAWTDSPAHLHSQLHLSSRPFNHFTIPPAGLLTDLSSSTSSNALVDETSTSSTQVNYNSGYMRTHGSTRYHGY